MQYANEAEYQQALANWLKSNGWQVDLEKPVGDRNEASGKRINCTGRIDIFAVKDEISLIIEAKTKAKFALQAASQLIRYSACFPEAQLWFACPDLVDPRVAQRLEAQGISVVPTEFLGLAPGSGRKKKARKVSKPGAELYLNEQDRVKQKALKAVGKKTCRCKTSFSHGLTEEIDCSGKAFYRVTLACSNSRCSQTQQVLIPRPGE